MVYCRCRRALGRFSDWGRIWPAPMVVFLLLALPHLACAFTGKVVRVLDGDTVEVLREGRPERVRLHGIDAPESGQDFGRKAKNFVLGVGAGQTVRVEARGKDRYGRTIGEIFLTDGRSLNKLLVGEGLAWWYRKYSDDTTLRDLEEAARKAGRGLWAGHPPVAPWEWRRGIREVAVPVQAIGGSEVGCMENRACGEMISCEEARFYLSECGLSSLDKDGDGVPCEKLCR